MNDWTPEEALYDWGKFRKEHCPQYLEDLWTYLVSEIGPSLKPPQCGPIACPDEDTGADWELVWDSENAVFDVELNSEGLVEWFYRNRASNTTESGLFGDLPGEADDRAKTGDWPEKALGLLRGVINDE